MYHCCGVVIRITEALSPALANQRALLCTECSFHGLPGRKLGQTNPAFVSSSQPSHRIAIRYHGDAEPPHRLAPVFSAPAEEEEVLTLEQSHSLPPTTARNRATVASYRT